MDEALQVRLFTLASELMEEFISAKDEEALSCFRKEFRFSDDHRLFKGDILHFKRFIQFLESNPDFKVHWKMRRYVGRDFEFAFYFHNKKVKHSLKDPNIVIMAWLYITDDNHVKRLSLDYNAKEIISELNPSFFSRIACQLKLLFRLYHVPIA